MVTYLEGATGEHLPLTLEISAGLAVRQNVALTRAAAVIEDTVAHGEVPQVGAFVLLMPKNPAERWAYRADQTDSDGSYGLATISPGDYFLVALSSGDDVAYRDARVAAILAGAAQLVQVAGAEHVELKLELVNTPKLKLPAL